MTEGSAALPLALLVFGTPSEETHLDLADAEGHHDADGPEDEEGHHHVGGIERAQRLDDEVAEPASRLPADELPDDHPDEGEGDGRGEGGEGPGKGGGHDDRAEDLALARAEEARARDQVGVHAP